MTPPTDIPRRVRATGVLVEPRASRTPRTQPVGRAWCAPFALGVLASLTGCGDDGRGALPQDVPSTDARAASTILLVSFDTTRADHIGAFGDERAHTPTIDALAARGRTFLRCESTAPITLPAHTSMLTGTYPAAHGVHDNTIFTIDARARLLSEALAESGFRCGGFVGSYVLDARFGLDQGFERYSAPDASGVGSSPEFLERPAAAVVDDALAWLDEVPAGTPAFVFAHFYDPHHPYAPPEPYATDAADAYAGEITYADAQLARLIAGLDARRPDGPRLIVVTSDHGEAFGEHGEPTHGVFVHEATMHVPLVVSGTEVAPARIATPVSLVDVAPTVVDWAARRSSRTTRGGAPRLPSAAGTSLLDEPPRGRALLLESLLPFHTRRWHPIAAVVVDDAKYVWTARPELYDLARDPSETHDLLAGDDAAARSSADALHARLSDVLAANPPLGWTRDDAAHDAESREKLAALGYLAARASDAPVLTPALTPLPLPDPKDRVDDLAALHEVRELLGYGRVLLGLDGEAAIPAGVDEATRDARATEALLRADALLDELAERTPDDPSLPAHRGLVALALGRPAEALSHFEQAARLDIDPAATHANLAACHAALGDEDRAMSEMQAALSLEPRMASAYDWLVTHHEARGDFGRAAYWRDEELRRGSPDDARKIAVLTDGGRLRRLAASRGQPVAP